jgi:hypothetical protein
MSLAILTVLLGAMCMALIWLDLCFILLVGDYNAWSLLALGIVFMGFGAAALSKSSGYAPLTSINLLWELASASYGLVLLQIYVQLHADRRRSLTQYVVV